MMSNNYDIECNARNSNQTTNQNQEMNSSYTNQITNETNVVINNNEIENKNKLSFLDTIVESSTHIEHENFNSK